MKRLLLSIALLLPLSASAQSELQPSYAQQAQGVMAAASVTNAYTTLLDNSYDLKAIDIVNGCDCVIYVSLNASTDHFALPASSTLYLPLHELNVRYAGDISIKYVGSACTTGSVYGVGIN